VDGDTVDVEIKRVVRIRLLQCWAPESRSTDPAVKKLGLASKANLQKLAPPGTPVVCHFPALGGEKLSESLSLDRVLGHVWPVDSKASLSQQQVEGGFAKADDPRGRH
jgi:endonuclease YncB( thermonuclease family)